MNEDVIRKFERLNECYEELLKLHKNQRALFESIDNARRMVDVKNGLDVLKAYEQRSRFDQMEALLIAYELVRYIQEKEL